MYVSMYVCKYYRALLASYDGNNKSGGDAAAMASNSREMVAKSGLASTTGRKHLSWISRSPATTVALTSAPTGW